MAKHKNRRRPGNQPQPTEVRIPLGTFPVNATAMLGILGEPGVMPHTIDVDRVVRGMLPGAFWRVARGIGQCPEGHQDGIIVGLPIRHVARPNGMPPDTIVLTCIDECEGRAVNLFFDRESLEQFVKRCGEVISESERRAAEAGVS